MSFDWSHYLELAKELNTGSSGSPIEEAKLRSAISRAYYAAFCVARNYLRLHRPAVYIPPGGEAHRIVKETFERDPDLVWRSIGIKLGRLRINRGTADYEDTVPGLSALAQLSLIVADEAITKIKAL
jgi:hypothetical protein